MKPRRKKPSDTTFKFRVRSEELQRFRAQAERDGFSTVTAWILWRCRTGLRDKKD